jgi:maleate isomerase
MTTLQMPVATNGHIRFGWRLRIGMLLPSSNQVAEPEMPSMLPEGVGLYTTRLKLVGGGMEAELAMIEKVEEAAELLADADVHLIAFHCTGVTTLNPEMPGNLKRRITAATGKPAVVTSEAVVAALNLFRAKRIVLISPYKKETNEHEVAFFAHHGIEVVHEHGLSLGSGAEFSNVDPQTWYRLGIEHRRDDVDAYFFSCATIRAAPMIDTLERDLRKPVVSSNQAMMWHALRTAGIDEPIAGFGKLFLDF